jgi:uncharacterized protein (DUF934 family)
MPPRRLLRDRLTVTDEWLYLDEALDEAAADLLRPDAVPSPLIVPFDRWLAEREGWIGGAGRLGVRLDPADPVEQLAQDLPRLDLVALRFPGPAEGRGYTQARLLRERWGFVGELRATGYVRHDQLFFLARCGCNAFELPDGEFASAERAFATFSAEYQGCNDTGLTVPLRHR